MNNDQGWTELVLNLGPRDENRLSRRISKISTSTNINKDEKSAVMVLNLRKGSTKAAIGWKDKIKEVNCIGLPKSQRSSGHSILSTTRIREQNRLKQQRYRERKKQKQLEASLYEFEDMVNNIVTSTLLESVEANYKLQSRSIPPRILPIDLLQFDNGQDETIKPLFETFVNNFMGLLQEKTGLTLVKDDTRYGKRMLTKYYYCSEDKRHQRLKPRDEVTRTRDTEKSKRFDCESSIVVRLNLSNKILIVDFKHKRHIE